MTIKTALEQSRLDYEPRDLCRAEPRRRSICQCHCTRDYDHTGRHYCGDCGWSWGRGKEPTEAEKKAAAV